MLFRDLNLQKDLLRGIEDAGLVECTPVQDEALGYALQGRDVLVQSQTGTGKTAAFLISLFQLMSGDEAGSRDKALIVAPTRELAVQIQEEARLLGVHLPFTIECIYGGVGYGRQEQMLREGIDIMVATPGRLIDFARQGKLNLRDVGYLVIDEADRLFDMGFLPDLRKIMRMMRPRESRQTMLFSATLSYTARHLASDYMREPAEVEIEPEQVTVDNVEQELYHVGQKEKMNLLLGLLARYEPSNCLLFVNMKHVAEEVAKRLKYNGYNCAYLSGDLSQSRRQTAIERFKTGETPVLVATDVAARGLHVDELELVVNYDLPEWSEYYVHRIGRTARAGCSGKAITLACEQYVEGLAAIEKFIGMKIPVVHAGDELYVEDKSAGRVAKSRRPRRGGNGRSSGGRDHGRGQRRGGRGQSRRQGSGGSSRSRSGKGGGGGGQRKQSHQGSRTHSSENRGQFHKRHRRSKGRRERDQQTQQPARESASRKQSDNASHKPAQGTQKKRKTSLFRKFMGIVGKR